MPNRPLFLMGSSQTRPTESLKIQLAAIGCHRERPPPDYDATWSFRRRRYDNRCLAPADFVAADEARERCIGAARMVPWHAYRWPVLKVPVGMPF
jgi:hypothetical protein